MKRVIEADAFAVFSSGDGVHDPTSMTLEVGTSATGVFKLAASFTGTATSARQTFKFGDQMTIKSRYWRLRVTDRTGSRACLPCTCCQASKKER